jgi:hypothetical protein
MSPALVQALYFLGGAFLGFLVVAFWLAVTVRYLDRRRR